ncbi:hydrogenase formation protein HypD [bacterium]|nr:hydrogenase formation protein HypD [bacterium]
MRFLDEYRNRDAALKLAGEIARIVTRPWSIMEICGGQTHAILRFGIDQLIPAGVALLHGPGCPVCVTAIETIDAAIKLASRPNIIFCSYGDMLRVPGSRGDLIGARAAGGDVRLVYSPLDALRIARENTRREIVFFAIGFETTAPASAAAAIQARRENLANFSMLVAHVLVPPALEAILSDPAAGVQGILAAGHVCTVTGWRLYEPIAARRRVPIVVTGFEPIDLLRGIHRCAAQLEAGRFEVENAYERAVRPDGNPAARHMIDEVFEVTDRRWRGMGAIPSSGLALNDAYSGFDAGRRFELRIAPSTESDACMSGAILRGAAKPSECPAFGGSCTPDHPLGATMVSSEGACAAYFKYARSNA